MLLENVLLLFVNKLQPGTHSIFGEEEKKDRQIAQYKICGSESQSFSTPNLLEFSNCP